MDERRPIVWEDRPSGLVAPLALDPTGQCGPTRHEAGGPFWRRTSPARYVPADTPQDCVFQHILEQGSRIRSYGAVTAWASLRFRGAPYFDGWSGPSSELAPVPIVTGPSLLRPDPRVSLTREQLDPRERELVDGVWLTVPERAVFDEMRRHRHLRMAVADIEVAVAAGLMTFGGFAGYVASRTAWTGIGLARDAVALAGFGCWSRTEAAMALIWMLDAGLPRPLCNVPIFDSSGRLIAIVDLLDPVAGCFGEYQGLHHKDPDRHRSDVARQAALRDVGLEGFEVVGGDLGDVDLVVKRMWGAYRRSQFRTPTERAWTLEQPAWWPDWAAARGMASLISG